MQALLAIFEHKPARHGLFAGAQRGHNGAHGPCKLVAGAGPEETMKLLIIIATLGLATFVVLRRRNPELANRVEHAVKDTAERVADEAPSDLAGRVRDSAKGLVG
jgi:hypothetical protein